MTTPLSSPQKAPIKFPPYGYPESSKLRLYGRNLGLDLAKATRENYAPDKIILDNHKDEFPKLLKYLQGSKTVYYTRENEKLKLRDWVLAQTDNSIDPVELYVKSLELNRGDVYLALFVAHDLLRNEFRFMAKYRTGYPSTFEKMAVFQNKFIDIRGDLSERGTDFYGDHRGSWYRIFGMMLYMVSESVTDQGQIEKNLWDARILGLIGAIGSEAVKPFAMQKDPDSPRKLAYNDAAARAGILLLLGLKKPALFDGLTGKPEDYLLPARQKILDESQAEPLSWTP